MSVLQIEIIYQASLNLEESFNVNVQSEWGNGELKGLIPSWIYFASNILFSQIKHNDLIDVIAKTVRYFLSLC